MITTPTCLILGAGASIPYGFPSGIELKEELCLCSTPNSSIHNALVRADFESEQVSAFGKALQYSAQKSIDAFLEHRNEFQPIGKAAITWSILRREGFDIPFYTSSQAAHHSIDFKAHTGNYQAEVFHAQFWYQELFSLLNKKTTPEDFKKNRLRIITFNYDRSLETFLFTALKTSYKLNDESVKELISNLEIIHVHGKVAENSWETPHAMKYPEYASIRIESKYLKSGVEKIKIVSEVIPDNEEFVKALKIISESQRIHFIGFSFNEDSLERLGFINHKIGNSTVISGSAYGMGIAEQAAVKQYFRQTRNVGNALLEISLENYDAFQYLKNITL